VLGRGPYRRGELAEAVARLVEGAALGGMVRVSAGRGGVVLFSQANSIGPPLGLLRLYGVGRKLARRPPELARNATGAAAMNCRRLGADSHMATILEAKTNLIIGFVISVFLGLFLYRLFGWDAAIREVTAITAAFTATSFCRTYAIRRLFIFLKRKGFFV